MSSEIRATWFWIVTLMLVPISVQAGELPWTRFTLANGLEVLVVENHLTPIVTVEIGVRNGSFTEPPEYNGLSHLYEHMFFTANARDSSEDDFLQRIDDLGIMYNGETREEAVLYYFTLPKENLQSGLDFMSDAIESLLFKPEELRKQKAIVLGEFDRNEASPFFNFTRKMEQAMWGDLTTRKEPLGQRSTIANATREKMLEIKDRYYVPNNSVLIVAGDVDPNEVRNSVPKYFESWKRGADPFKNNEPPRPKPLTRSVLVADTVEQPRSTIEVQWHGPSIGLDDKGTIAADVFSFIVTQPEHEFTKSFEDSGLSQGVGFGYYTQRNVGPITATVSTTPDKLKESLAHLWKEIDRFDDPNYFSDEELQTAKNYLRTSTLYRSESLSEYSQELAFWWSTAGLDYYEHYLDDIDKITRQDVIDYVHRYIQGKPYVVGLALSRESWSKLGDSTRKLLPQP